MSSWQEDLVGKTVLVLSAPVLGIVAKLYAPGAFLRDGAAEGEKPIAQPVLQLTSGHAFLADDIDRGNFRVMSEREVFIFESMQEVFSSAVSTSFRLAIASGQISPEDALVFLLSVMAEAERALTAPDPQPETETADAQG